MEAQNPIKAVLAFFFLYFFCLGSDAQDACFPEIRVKRNTVWRISEMSSLKMSCSIKYCEDTPGVKWCRLDDQGICIPLNESPSVKIWQEPNNNEDNVIMSYLEIKEITKNYSGSYRCLLSPNAVGHAINVSIGGSDQHTNTSNTDSSTVPSVKHTGVEWLPYIYICGGILAVVIVVMIISLLSIYGCKRSSCLSHSTEPTGPFQKTEQIAQNQYPTRRTSARGTPSPSAPKRDRSLRCQPTQSPVLPKAAAYDNNHFNETHSLHGLLTLPRAPYSQGSPSIHRSAPLNESQANSRDRRPSQVLYAALDHLAPRDASRTVPKFQPQEEFSEYASIRIS